MLFINTVSRDRQKPWYKRLINEALDKKLKVEKSQAYSPGNETMEGILCPRNPSVTSVIPFPQHEIPEEMWRSSVAGQDEGP